MTDISVIMPVYNTEKYLAQSIESVISQAGITWELICIDDGSTDSSLTILQEYKKKFPSTIRIITQMHQGLSIARNVGIDIAKGRYIYFMDSDDYLEDSALAYIVHECDYQSLDVFFASFRNICDDVFLSNKYSKMLSGKKRTYSLLKPVDGHEMFCQLFRTKEYYCMVWCYCCSANFIKLHNLTFPPDICYEDQVFTYEVLNYAHRVCCTDKIIYNKRIRGGSICVDNDLTEYVKGYSYTIDFLKEMISHIDSKDSPYFVYSTMLLEQTVDKLNKKIELHS